MKGEIKKEATRLEKKQMLLWPSPQRQYSFLFCVYPLL
jgi:hypothetical protein